MATTKNAIYYPNDYDSIADILKDMKKIAESVDSEIEKINNLLGNIETNLGELEEEQVEQNESISNNTAEITKLKKENEELAQLMPWKTTEIVESIHVEDSSKYSKNKLSMFGNLTESLANNTQEKSPDNPATISNVTGVQKIRVNNNIVELNLGNIELAKIEDTNGNTLAQDRIVKRNINDIWKWQIEENVEKVLFNGTELWRVSFVNNSVGTARFAKQLSNISTFGSKSYNNFFKTRINEAHTDTEYLYMPSDTIYINVNKNRLAGETIEDFQVWLSENNLEVYYKALETKYTDCSAELSKQLDKLYNLSLDKGINNIFIESTNGVTAEMQLEYVQDINAKYKTLADRITALENA